MENVGWTATEAKTPVHDGFEEAKPMKKPTCSSEDEKLSLKEPSGWFAAGNGFRKASTLLSDGAFKLFVYLCMEANRHTGCLQRTHQELATALGKSKRSIGTHVRELQVQGFCKVVAAHNQYGRTMFEISDGYWPYCRREPGPQSSQQQAYVDSIREYFLSFGCVSGRFSTADEQMAKHLYDRAIPLAVIENAMLLGACRKYVSWLNNQALEPIQSLRYFEPLIAEIQAQFLPPGYSAYLRRKIQELTTAARSKQREPAAYSEPNAHVVMTGPIGGTSTSTGPKNAAYKQSSGEKLSLKGEKSPETSRNITEQRAYPATQQTQELSTDCRLLAQKFHQQSDKTEETR